MTVDQSKKAQGAQIIAFPKKHCRTHILSKEAKKRNERGKEIHASYLATQLEDRILEILPEIGINIFDEDVQRDFSFMIDIAGAMIDRTLGIKNDLHDYLNNYVKQEDEFGNVDWVYKDPETQETKENNEAKGAA